MTEQEDIELLQNLNVKLTEMSGNRVNGIDEIFGWNEITAICEAIKALEEVQQYRAIENELKERYRANVGIKEVMHYFIETIFKGENHDRFCFLTNEDAEQWESYKAIGTVDECRSAVEKQKEMIAYCDENDCFDCPYHNGHWKENRCMNDFIADEIVKGGGVNE